MQIRSTFSEGLESELPSSLPYGYPYFATDSKRLFVGRGDNTAPEPIKSELEFAQGETIEGLLRRVGIIEETLEDRLGDFGSKDVDESEIADGRIPYYDQEADKMRYIDPNIFHADPDSPINQVTLYDVTASVSNPHKVYIDIPKTINFNRPPLEILKFKESEENVVVVAATYSNAEAVDFIPNKYIRFDGAMKLETEYIVSYELLESTVDGSLWESETILLDEFKHIEQLDVLPGNASDVVRSVIKLPDGYFAFIQNEWIKIKDTQPTRLEIQSKGMPDLSVITTPTNKSRYTMKQDTTFEGQGALYRTTINVSKFGSVSKIEVVR